MAQGEGRIKSFIYRTPRPEGGGAAPAGARGGQLPGRRVGEIKWGGRPGIGWAHRRIDGWLSTTTVSGAATRPYSNTAAITTKNTPERGWRDAAVAAAVPGARGGGLCASVLWGRAFAATPGTRVGGGTLPSSRLVGPRAGGGTLPSPRRLPGARGGGFCASAFVGARLRGKLRMVTFALPHLRMELERVGAGCGAPRSQAASVGDRNEFGRLAELAEPICRTLPGGWSGSRTVHVSGRPGWWSRALCRSREWGKSRWVGGRGLGGRAGGPEDGFSRPQASGAATRPCRMEAPTAKRLSAERVGAVRTERPARSRSAGRKAAGTTMALPPE